MPPVPEWVQSIESRTLVEIGGGFVGGLLVAYFARYRARRQWEGRHLVHHLNVSLNIFADGRLKIRTVFERPLEEIVPNLHARELVMAASKRATADDPVLVLPSQHHGFVLNYILNATAEHFSAAALRADLGVPVASAKYALFLTCEPATEDRQRKLRAMLLKSDLMRSFPFRDEMPMLERPHHADRIRTLRVAARKFAESPELFPIIELSA